MANQAGKTGGQCLFSMKQTLDDAFQDLGRAILPGIEFLSRAQYAAKFKSEPPSDPTKPFKAWVDTRESIKNQASRFVIYQQALVISPESGAPIVDTDTGIYRLDVLAMTKDEALSFNFTPETGLGGKALPFTLPAPLLVPVGFDVFRYPDIGGGPMLRDVAKYNKLLAGLTGGSSSVELAGLLAQNLAALEDLRAIALELRSRLAQK